MSSQPFFLNELFWGFIGLIALGISILIEMRKSRHMFSNLIEYLGGATQSSIDEKIAVLYAYVMDVHTWRSAGININLMISRITSDINSIARVRNKMTWDQWRELHKVLIKLIDAMRDAQIDSVDIEASREALK